MGLDETRLCGVMYLKFKRGGWEMDAGITRQEALELMQAYLRAENLRKHCLATEAIMLKRRGRTLLTMV